MPFNVFTCCSSDCLLWQGGQAASRRAQPIEPGRRNSGSGGRNYSRKVASPTAFYDQDPQIRKAAVQICERYLVTNDPPVLEKLRPLLNDSSALVCVQLSLSLRQAASPEATSMMQELLAANSDNEVIQGSWQKYIADGRARSLEEKMAGMNEDDKNLIRRGAVIFQ